MNKLKTLMGFMGCLILSGCSLNPARTTAAPHAEALVAQDMVNLLVQIEELPTATTTLNFPSRPSVKDPFSLIFAEKLRDAGYAVRTAGINPGETIVSYKLAREMDPQHGVINTYTISIGGISARRAYVTIDEDQIMPLALMQVKGTSAADLSLDNQLFENQSQTVMPQGDVVAEREVALQDVSTPPLAPSNSAVQASLPSRNPDLSLLARVAPQLLPSNLEQTVNPSLLNIVAPTTYGATGRVSEISALRELSNAPTKNLRELGQSNFADALASLAIVKEVILTFDNDSVRMGPVNKSRVSELVGQFDGGTDIFSVIGCSNGATSISIGQKGLALGRAERVKEELLFAGVPAENILKEGCWAGEPYDERMPRRGVVLSLKRRPA